jgi:hypothetical protein
MTVTKIELLLAAVPGTDPVRFADLAADLHAATGAMTRATVHDPSILSGLAHGEETADAPPFAAFVEVDADGDVETLLPAVAGALAATTWVDAPNCSVVIGPEFTVVPGDESLMLAMALTRRNGMTREDFTEYWSTKHAELGRQVPGSEGYRQVHFDADLTATARQLTGFGGPVFDGVALAYYSTDQALLSILANAEVLAPLLEDERLFIDHSQAAMIVGRRPIT